VSAAARFSGIEGRRSTRIDRTVPLIVMGQTKLGLSFQERTSAVSVNLHGCRYPSRHDYSVGSWVGLQVLESNGETTSTIMRAQVRSIHPPMSPRELYQIGVELEAPSNVWNVPAPPDDWHKILGASGSKMQMATGVAPARETGSASTALPPPAMPIAPERPSAIAAFPAPPASPLRAEPAKAERVVITSDQLVAAVQGKLQQAAEKAVHTAINTHLMDAVRKALTKIDDVYQAHTNQIQDQSVQSRQETVDSVTEQVLRRVDARLAELSGPNDDMAQRLQSISEQSVNHLNSRLAEEHNHRVAERAEISRQHEEITQQLQSISEQATNRLNTRLEEDLNHLQSERATLSDQQEEVRQLLQSVNEQAISRVNARLDEEQSHRDEERAAMTERNEQLAQRLEKLAAEAEDKMTTARQFADSAHNNASTAPIHLTESVEQATAEFESAATRVSDRQLVRLMEDKQMVTREASSQLAACAAESRAMLQTAASATMDEFRRQMQVHVDLVISEATQRVMSSLASLDAESRSAIETRRRSIDTDIARATEQSTEQFRSGMKAFLYSCLVAAVGAVDEHAKVTLHSLKDNKAGYEIDSLPGSGSGEAHRSRDDGSHS
jgi:hypothetical protein